MGNIASRTADWLARAERGIGTRRGLGIVAAAALAEYAVESLAWPLTRGRDAATFLGYYVDFWHANAVFPQLMLFRTPGAPLLLGPPMDAGGSALTEGVMAVAFAISIVAVTAAARSFGGRVALAAAVALLLSPSYGALFHTVSSDAPFALGFALWTLVVVRTIRAPSVWRFAANGAVVFLLVLFRPGNQFLVAFAIVPIALSLPLARRLAYGGAFLGVVLLLLAGWAAVNDVRYGEFTINRDAGSQALYRVFVYDGLVRPENGPATRKLATAVRSDLLPREPYRSYRIDLDRFFSSGSSRMWSDLIPLSDRRFGWGSDYRTMREAAFEAIRRHPAAYARAVVSTVWIELRSAYRLGASSPPEPPREPATKIVAGKRLPVPTEGEPIPASNLDWLASTPHGTIRTDWSSLAHPRLVFQDPAVRAHYERYQAHLDRLMRDLPNRRGSARLADALNRASRLYPPMILWLVVGTIAALLRRKRGLLAPASLCALAVLVLVGTALVQPATVEFRLPFDPAFVLFAAAALVGGRERDR